MLKAQPKLIVTAQGVFKVLNTLMATLRLIGMLRAELPELQPPSAILRPIGIAPVESPGLQLLMVILQPIEIVPAEFKAAVQLTEIQQLTVTAQVGSKVHRIRMETVLIIVTAVVEMSVQRDNFNNR